MTTSPEPRSGRVDQQTLVDLLAEQAEAPWLDYKTAADLDDQRSLVEIVKDIGAMSMDGGYLVIGADDKGGPAGAPLSRPKLFDEARLSAKVKKYLPSVMLRTASYSQAGQDYTIVYVAPHPDGFAIFAIDGHYTHGTTGKHVTVFRAGEVVARHGTASERWQQGDVARIRSRLRAGITGNQDAAARLPPLADQLIERLDRAWLAWLLVAAVPSQAGSGEVNQASVTAAEQLADSWARDALPVGALPIGSQLLHPHLTGGAEAGPRIVLDYDLNTGRPSQHQRVELYPDGASVAGLVVGRAEPRSTAAQCPVFADRVELETANLLELCRRHADAVVAGGDLHLLVVLLSAVDDDGDPVPTVLTDDDLIRGVRPIAGHVPQLAADVSFTANMAAAERDEPTGTTSAAYRLAAGLLSAGGRPQPRLLQPDGTLDPTWSLLTWRRPLQHAAVAHGILSPTARLL